VCFATLRTRVLKLALCPCPCTRYAYLHELADRAAARGGWRVVEVVYEAMQADSVATLRGVLAALDPALLDGALSPSSSTSSPSVGAARGDGGEGDGDSRATPVKFHGEDCSAMMTNYDEVEAHFRAARDAEEADGATASPVAAPDGMVGTSSSSASARQGSTSNQAKARERPMACLYRMLVSREAERFGDCYPKRGGI
jgi:hypothetical protein